MARHSDTKKLFYYITESSIKWNRINNKRITIREVRTALKNLSKCDKELTIKTTNRYTIITVENLHIYQSKNLEEKTKNDMQAVMLTTTSKECKKHVNNNKTKDKKLYGEFSNVKLTEEEYSKLLAIYESEKRLKQGVEILSTYLASKGDKYKNHYAVLGKHNWVYNKVNQASPVRLEENYNAFI